MWCGRPIMRFTIVLAMAGLFYGCEGLEAQHGESLSGDSPEGGRLFRHDVESVYGRQWMVSTANPLATHAAWAALDKGASAIDGAIIAQMVLNVVEPQSSGIGGSGFLLYYEKASNSLFVYDGREEAPDAMPQDAFLDDTGTALGFMEASSSGMAVGVPGLLAMLEHAHERHGAWAWQRLFDDAIDKAQNGFAISPRLHNAIKSNPWLLIQDGEGGFFDDEGQPLAIGSVYKNAPLAHTLRAIRERGRAAFYEGERARAIVAAIQESPHNVPAGRGVMTLSDLSSYDVKVRAPLCRPYGAWRVCSLMPPSSGGVAIAQILALLEPFAVGQMDDVTYLHMLAEAMRLAYRDRARFLADSDMVSVPVEGLLAPSYVERRRALIGTERARPYVTFGAPHDIPSAIDNNDDIHDDTRDGKDTQPERVSTTHISIIDREGNAVAMTSSIGPAFGSSLRVDGFYLNGELTDFAFMPHMAHGDKSHVNRAEGGKRPLSSMSPTIVFDDEGRVRLVLGSAGGVHIIAYVVRVLLDVLDRGIDIQDALSMGHFVKKEHGDRLWLEEGRQLERWQSVLEEKGHGLSYRPMNSGVHAIYVDDDGGLWGAVDPRREGLARGDMSVRCLEKDGKVC